MSEGNCYSIEDEIIALRAIVELIDGIINPSMFDVLGERNECEIRFETECNFRLFSILLVDFLSPPDLKELTGDSYLAVLRRICDSPSFNSDTIHLLSNTVEKFKSWLDEEVVLKKVHFASIKSSPEIDLPISRFKYIKMCGNISKHSLARLWRVAEELKQLLARADHVIEKEDALVALEDFYEHCYNNVLLYHSSWVAEFLNDIRWGIQEYLTPEYFASKHCWPDENLNLVRYAYRYPDGVESEFSRICYWDLMNLVRRKPYVDKFSVTDYLKQRY